MKRGDAEGISPFVANIYDVSEMIRTAATSRGVYCMRKLLAALAVLILFAMFMSTASASLAQFAGKWVNADSETGGLTKLKITVSGTNVAVQAWGRCHPTDCDWGSVKGVAYATSVSSNLASDARGIIAVFKESFKESTMIIQPTGNHLRVSTYTRFTDGSGRTNYVSEETFNKA